MRNNTLQYMTMINRASIAFFENLIERENIDISQITPTCSPFKEIVGTCFNEEILTVYKGAKYFHREKIEIDNDLNDEIFIEDFMNENLLVPLEKAADNFITLCLRFPNSDIIFSRLKEFVPFASTTDEDPETNFIFRFSYVPQLGASASIILEFDYLLVERIREINNEP